MAWRLSWPRMLYWRVSGALWTPTSAPVDAGALIAGRVTTVERGSGAGREIRPVLAGGAERTGVEGTVVRGGGVDCRGTCAAGSGERLGTVRGTGRAGETCGWGVG